MTIQDVIDFLNQQQQQIESLQNDLSTAQSDLYGAQSNYEMQLNQIKGELENELTICRDKFANLNQQIDQAQQNNV